MRSNPDPQPASDRPDTEGGGSIGADIVGILDTIDVPIVVIGRDCALVRFNRAATEVIRLAPSDIGQRVGSVAAFADVKDIEKLCSQVINDETPCRRDIRSGDRWFLLRLAPYAMGAGQIAGAVLTFTNVTAFRASLEQAIYEREYTKAILNTVTTPLVVLDRHLRVQSANRAFYSMFGASREQTHGVPLCTLGDDDWRGSAVWTLLNQVLSADTDLDAVEVTCDFPAAGRRTVLLDARQISRDRHSPILLAMQDITQRKRTEETLQDADRRKDEFLAMLAHELRNPLAPIRTGLELIRLSGDTPQSVGRVRAIMERQVSHMVRLIDDLLDVSRITSGKIVLQRAPTPLAELVQAAIEAQRATIDAANIDLAVEMPAQVCVIDVDPTRFVQILSNVLHNASKFTPSHGKIRCSADIVRGDAPPHVSITVSDTGVGISKDLLPRMFDLFTQAKSSTERAGGGLGIGLALARRLTEMHGGTLTGTSEGPGRGSTFMITIPLSDADAAQAATMQHDPPHVASRVVIIDDNVDAAHTLSMLVERLGGAARVAHDAGSGLDAVREFQPDIVFLDIGMPGIDGYETCRRLRQQQPSQKQIVVVAVTGWGQSQDKQRALDAGFDAHLTKPVDPAAVSRVLSANAPRQST